MNRIHRTCLLFVLVFSLEASAYEPERALVNYAHELAECSAYYKLASDGFAANGDTEKAGTLLDLAKLAFVMSVELSNVDVTNARVGLAISSQTELVSGSYSNMSILINKYGELCRVAVDESESRMNYWLQKD